MLALHVIAYYSKEIKWSRDRELKWEERDGRTLKKPKNANSGGYEKTWSVEDIAKRTVCLERRD